MIVDLNYSSIMKKRECRDCSEYCKRCIKKETCDECYGGRVLRNGVCVNKCDTGEIQIEGKCVKCSDDNCLICSSLNLNQCYKCKQDYVLKGDDCVKECKENYYTFTSYDNYKECKLCPNNCKNVKIVNLVNNVMKA